jgi:hypothetical protein
VGETRVFACGGCGMCYADGRGAGAFRRRLRMKLLLEACFGPDCTWMKTSGEVGHSRADTASPDGFSRSSKEENIAQAMGKREEERRSWQRWARRVSVGRGSKSKVQFRPRDPNNTHTPSPKTPPSHFSSTLHIAITPQSDHRMQVQREGEPPSWCQDSMSP